MQARVMEEIIAPTLSGMAAMGCPFTGVLYAGLMVTDEDPKLIEYNVRFGDPECQVIMPRLRDDLLPLLKAAAEGALGDATARWTDDTALTVVMCAPGYPAAPEKGSVIGGLDKAGAMDGVTIFHAGTARRGGDLVANGGRVLNVTATGSTVSEAQALAYRAVEAIDWPDGFCRSDIGWRAIERER
jgi:phosphoribosylamine--glycine ligase